MLIKWCLLGTFLFLSCYVSYTESSFLPQSQYYGQKQEEGVLRRIWNTFSEMGRKFVEKLKSLVKILPFFNHEKETSHTMKVSKIMDKIQMGGNEKGRFEIFDGVFGGQQHNRFKRMAKKSNNNNNKRRRSGDDELSDEQSNRNADENDELAAEKRKKKKKRGKGKSKKRSSSNSYSNSHSHSHSHS